MGLIDDARDMHGDLRELRRAVHAEPETGLHLPRTQERVLKALQGLPIETTLGTSTTSVTGVIRGGAGGGEGPAVLLRGDMDALPVQERADVPYRSRVDGVMHACGHDLHTAMLVGAAWLLQARRHELPGDVVLMFQPGEEGWHGARHMVDEGVLTAAGRKVDAAFGLHVFSGMDPRGVFGTRPGTMMASSDTLRVTVHGRGGHGAAPHGAADPVPAVAEVVTALQTAVSRRFSVFDPVVVTVGLLRAGTQSNVIPDDAYLEATVRTFSTTQRERASQILPRVAQGVAQAHGLEAEAVFDEGLPVTVNHDDEAEFALEVVQDTFGDRVRRWSDPVAGAEGFSYVLQEVPGAFLSLGATEPGVELQAAESNHSPRVVFDDEVPADGAALLAELAVRRLARPVGSRSTPS